MFGTGKWLDDNYRLVKDTELDMYFIASNNLPVLTFKVINLIITNVCICMSMYEN